MKWLSLDNHVHNVHSGHYELFPECSHGPPDEQGRNKKWFTRCKQLLQWEWGVGGGESGLGMVLRGVVADGV